MLLFFSFSSLAQVNQKEEWIKLDNESAYVLSGSTCISNELVMPYAACLKCGWITQFTQGGVKFQDISISRDGKRFLLSFKNTRMDTNDMKNYFYCPKYNDTLVAADWRSGVHKKIKNDSLFIFRYFYFPAPPNSKWLSPIIKFSGDIEKSWGEKTNSGYVTISFNGQPKPKRIILHVDTIEVIDLLRPQNFTIEGLINENAYYQTPIGYLRINKDAIKHRDKSNFAFTDSTLFDKNKNLWYFKLPQNYKENNFVVSLPVINNGTDTLRLLLGNEQPYNVIEFPHTLAPGQKGWIKIDFDLTYLDERGKYRSSLSLVTRSGKNFQVDYLLSR